MSDEDPTNGISIVLIALLPACHNELRGSTATSDDGKTYLIVADDNGGKCGPLLVDGRPWPYRIGERGPIGPGAHKIDCGGEVDFEVQQGTVFTFGYWGP